MNSCLSRLIYLFFFRRRRRKKFSASDSPNSFRMSIKLLKICGRMHEGQQPSMIKNQNIFIVLRMTYRIVP